ncbi:hypothetical protein N9D31_02900 [Oligoflexaceae bacterium]|nr:hypothetical protein [Oligoflexaceae bacterium]
MNFVTSQIKIALIAVALLATSCKTRQNDFNLSSELSSQACYGKKQRLSCPFSLGFTHSTGGECTQRFVTRLFGDKYVDADDNEGAGFDLWNGEGQILKGQSLEQMTLRVEVGRFREAYNPTDGRWYSAMKPFYIQTRDTVAEPVVFEWKIDTMGAPNNSRILKTLVKLGYFTSGERFDESDQIDPRIDNKIKRPESNFFSSFQYIYDADNMGPGVEWNNYRERNERRYKDPYDFFLDSKKTKKIDTADLAKKIAAIKGKKDYPYQLKAILNDYQYTDVDSHPCNRSVWGLDKNFEKMISKEADGNVNFKTTKNRDKLLQIVFQELAVRKFFRNFHFNTVADIPFIGSEPNRSPFFSSAENSYWAFQFKDQNQQIDFKDNIPVDLFFGDLVLFNNSRPSKTFGRLIQTNPTQLAIVPFLANAENGEGFGPSTNIWTYGKDADPKSIQDKSAPVIRNQPTVLGRFINRDQAYIKMKRFIDESRRLAIIRSGVYNTLQSKTNTLINNYADAISDGKYKKLLEKEVELARETDPVKVKAISEEMVLLQQDVSIEIDVIRQIADATRIAYWNYQSDDNSNSSADDSEDSFFANIKSAPNEDIMIDVKEIMSNDSKKTLIEAFTQAIRSRRPANAKPVEDLRIMSIKLVPEKEMIVNEQNLYENMDGITGTLAPKIQKEIRGIE